MANWHTEKMAQLKTYDVAALEYTRDDALAAAKAGETIGNPKTGQYWDEYHYCCMELKARRDAAQRAA